MNTGDVQVLEDLLLLKINNDLIQAEHADDIR